MSEENEGLAKLVEIDPPGLSKNTATGNQRGLFTTSVDVSNNNIRTSLHIGEISSDDVIHISRAQEDTLGNLYITPWIKPNSKKLEIKYMNESNGKTPFALGLFDERGELIQIKKPVNKHGKPLHIYSGYDKADLFSSSLTFNTKGSDSVRIKVVRTNRNVRLSVADNFLPDFWNVKKSESELQSSIDLTHTTFDSHIYPNPFNPETTISYVIGQNSQVKIIVYNIYGQEIVKLHDGPTSKGNHSVTLNGTQLASGQYFVRFILSNSEIGQKQVTKSITLIK